MIRSFYPAFFTGAVLFAVPMMPAASGSSRSPVLVELFTSEGCSSCPPADRLLADLEKQLGPNVIVLSEHVDYWDYIGWRDPFASAAFTARQRNYARALGGEDGVYTPQMVIDGRAGFVGSDSRRAQSEIKRAAAQSKTPISIDRRGDSFAVSVAAVPANANVVVAIAEAGLESDVRRGENSGHVLRHTGVARSLTSLGKAERGKAFAAEFTPKIDPVWKRENLRVVVFLEDRDSRRILGSAAVPVF